jgi:hypothetical protein
MINAVSPLLGIFLSEFILLGNKLFPPSLLRIALLRQSPELEHVSKHRLMKRLLREALNKLNLLEKRPSGAKARIDSAAFAARLKSCPFKTET